MGVNCSPFPSLAGALRVKPINTENTENNSDKKSLFFILKGVYTSNLFETCFMVANDDLKGKTTHLAGFYTNSISGPKILKPCP